MPRAEDATTYETDGQIIADACALVRREFAEPLENAYGNCLSWLDQRLKRLQADRELDEDTDMSEEKQDAEVAAQESHASKHTTTASVSLRRGLLSLHPLIRQNTQVLSTDDVKVAAQKGDVSKHGEKRSVSSRTDVLPLHPLTQYKTQVPSTPVDRARQRIAEYKRKKEARRREALLARSGAA